MLDSDQIVYYYILVSRLQNGTNTMARANHKKALQELAREIIKEIDSTAQLLHNAKAQNVSPELITSVNEAMIGLLRVKAETALVESELV